MKLKVEIDGVGKLVNKLNRLSVHESVSAFRRAAREIAVDIQQNAQKETPVKTGNLRQSARNKLGSISNRGASAVVYYLANYAIYVHEHTWKKHATGSAKFLEKAVYAEVKKAKEILKKRILEAMEAIRA